MRLAINHDNSVRHLGFFLPKPECLTHGSRGNHHLCCPVTPWPQNMVISSLWKAARISRQSCSREGYGSRRCRRQASSTETVYGDYIEGLEEDFWQILEYFGQDFAQPKMKQSATVGYSQAIPYHLQPVNFPLQNETPNLPIRTFW